jgi:hypothetical protein
LSLPFESLKIWFQSGCVDSHEAGRAGMVVCAQDFNPDALAQNIHHAVRDLESCLFGKSITQD